MANNLRDIPTDEDVGKRTLAVVLGDRRTRMLYPALVVARLRGRGAAWRPVAPGRCSRCWRRRWRRRPSPRSAPGTTGRALVPVLQGTGKLQLAYGVLLAVGLALS